MNPFLQPTVATPDPDPHWGSSPPRVAWNRKTKKVGASLGIRDRRVPKADPDGGRGDTSKNRALGSARPGIARSESLVPGVESLSSHKGGRLQCPGGPSSAQGRALGSSKGSALALSTGMASPPSWRRAGHYIGRLTLAGCLFFPAFAVAVDLNAATAQELQQVKGIGPKMAQVIIDERERGGRFESLSDFTERVKGVGPKKAASFEAAGLKVGNAPAVAVSEVGQASRPAGKPRRSR